MLSLQSLFNTFLFYGGVLLLPISPGVLAWKLFKNKKGKIPFISRDLICDTETLMSLPKSENSLDEFTTAFSPFIPLLTLNGLPWKTRRKIFSAGIRKINIDKDFKFDLPLKKGDIYWDIYQNLFSIGFEMVFGRLPSKLEFEDMYPGIEDINRLIKRQIGLPNMNLRWKLYYRTKDLLTEENSHFIFADSAEFRDLNEIDQISLIVEDFLTSICIQCSDLICHMILLYPNFKEAFKTNLDHCINETLRLYPLTDIWTRKSYDAERGWIASLTQLNRTGWSEPDSFLPERWVSDQHPPLISWGFDARSCPASRIGYNLSKKIFANMILNEKLQILPASNYYHDRTFLEGCQVWIAEDVKPTPWKYKGKWKNQLNQWISSRLRLIDQGELW